MRVIALPEWGEGRRFGLYHGERYAGEIASLAQLRLHLTVKVGGFSSGDEVLALAEKHLPVLAEFDRMLYDELVGIADGAGVSPAEVIVLNHYTDLRDLNRPSGAASAEADALSGGGCTVLFARTDSGNIVAQTWDMHATAMPYVAMLEVPRHAGRPAALVLSLTGCLGMAGINEHGVAVAINNLHSTDARVGVAWSAVVRAALTCQTADDAADRIMASPLGSGHHYLVADPDQAFGIETSGRQRAVVFDNESDSYVHTNHCFDDVVDGASRVPDGSTTYDRLRLAIDDLANNPIKDIADAYLRLGSTVGYPRSVCTNMATAERPHAPATCAAISMDLSTREMLAVAGLPHNVEPERFAL